MNHVKIISKALMQFETKYGYFSDDGNEYVIKTHNTPKPWINVISNGKYGLVISQTGGGFSWHTHSEFNRLNRWHQDLIQDNWGKYFYIKDYDTNEVWSPTWMPVKKKLDKYTVVHGIGYSRFESEFKNIKVTLTVYVPLNEELELWNFSINNKNNRKINLSIYTYFEWCLGSSADHHREFHKTFLETEFNPNLNCLLATKRLWEIPLGDRGHWNIEYPYYGFISCSEEITDYDSDKETFIGRFSSVELPDGIFSPSLKRKTGKWNDSVAAVKINVPVNPGEEKKLHFTIGIKKNPDEIDKSLNKFKNNQAVNSAFTEVKKFWQDLLNKTTFNTPDKSINLLANKWLRYQAISGRLWARTAYYQQSGALGFRDQLQDSLIFLQLNPSLTLEQIRLHARHQFRDGTVLHWWHPITETGLQTKMTDDLLWLPFVLVQYINETGDYKCLKIREPYYDDPSGKDSLFNHSIAAIEKVLTRFSKRGLPLIGAGDWNDGLSAVGLDMKGESIWLSEFLYLILIEFSELCETIEEEKLSKKFKRRAVKLKKAFDKYAWDGEWFYRATKDNGKRIGSRLNDEGRIYLNAQTWSLISGIAGPEKAAKALNAVTVILLQKNGPLLLYPSYSIPDKMIGYLSRYAPGRRENGGVYIHAATWLIWAYSLVKEGDAAYEIYKRLSPINNGSDPDLYQAEPYVTPGNIDGPDSPNYGMGGWTWYTGSATWLQKVIVERILGIKATPKGLLIDPCIPENWKEFSVKRMFRGKVYNISICNENNVSSGIKRLIVNGKETNNSLLNIKGKNPVDVKVFMG